MGHSQRAGKVQNSLDLHRSPVSRERIGLGATYLLCVRYLHVPTQPVNGKAWACTVEPQ